MPFQLVTGHSYDRVEDAVWIAKGLDHWSLTLTVEGTACFPYPGGEYLARPGDVVLHRPHTLYAMRAAHRNRVWENLWAGFMPRSEWYPLLNWPTLASGLMLLTLRDAQIRKKITARMMDVHHLATGHRRMREVFAMNALEEVMLWCDTQNPDSEQDYLDTPIQNVMDYLCHNLMDKITLESLAERSGLSVSGLVHLFRRQTGMTIMQFLELQRLNRAKQLLERTGRRIQTIAMEVGYDSPFYFSQRFKRQHGISPRDYRKQSRSR
jgi:AraC family transcriptional regulator of arabinose operon